MKTLAVELFVGSVVLARRCGARPLIPGMATRMHALDPAVPLLVIKRFFGEMP